MIKAISERKILKSALGAALTVLCGFVLWKTPPGEPWVRASYDYLFRFGSPGISNRVVLIQLDNAAYQEFHQARDQHWDRAAHAELLERLRADQARLVVFDAFFIAPEDTLKDNALAGAMRRQGAVVLAARQARLEHQTATNNLIGAQPTLPTPLFLASAGSNNWGVAWLDPDLDSIVRRHWPFPSPGPSYPSLPWKVAELAGAQLGGEPHERWLRYYGRDGVWPRLSYRFALKQPPNFYRDKIVFIGNQPATSVPDGEPDEFQVPYTRWTGESAGGVEIMITEFLNLMNGDWLERPPWWAEALLLAIAGALLGGLWCRLRPLTACISAAAVALAVALGAVAWTYHTNRWFPWLVVAGGQVPCALAWSLITSEIRRTREIATATALLTEARSRTESERPKTVTAGELPEIPDYELIDPPFGAGAYGKVWLARNAVGQWQALKVVYRANFGENPAPYEREFNGIRNYKPISDKHRGLLRVDFVSRKRPDFFYYVMELGDALEPGWELEPVKYKPRDLAGERARAPGHRLPVRDCVRIGLELTETLGFLHGQGLTHRDIKPQNVIFVSGSPKLADVGLISEIGPEDRERTSVGTPGYMPPPPERPGTAQADIYALGVMLYVLSTGRNTTQFPELSTSLVEAADPADFFHLNSIILKACHPERALRFGSAAEMHEALEKAHEALKMD